MKAVHIHIKTALLLTCLFFVKFSFSQGRVVINEYMPWTVNGCGATGEFVELMNFGPGPINIGCYILTDGDYSVTIPPNTILKPGEFYVVAGRDTIGAPCANIDSTIHADLNWTTCGCTSGVIPSTGDGFFTDGGSANEQVVLLDPNLKVVDAVIRDLPAEPSSSITTSTIGGCGSKTFDLDTMTIKYEVLGMSTGRGNSFARILDGDCEWDKDPQQSANATNNRSGDVSDVSYTLSIVKSMDCDASHGSIDIYVDVGTYTGQVFPMKYTIALDSDNNGIFNFSDTYSYGIDSTAPSVAITGLPLGRYKITIESVYGCFLKTFDVTILECADVLPVQLVYFKLLEQQSQTLTFQWLLGDASQIKSVAVEKSVDGTSFLTASSLENLHYSGSRSFTEMLPRDHRFLYYRLRLTGEKNKITYSPVIRIGNNAFDIQNTGPNPVADRLSLKITSETARNTSYVIYDLLGAKRLQGHFYLKRGNNPVELPVASLPAGVYQLVFTADEPFSLRFVKR